MRSLWVVGLVLAAVALGCRAPSIRMVERGNTYFERCDAADRDPDVGDPHRQRCWEAWLDHYTEGQSVERIRHARARVASLAVAVHEAERAAEATAGGEAIASSEADAGAPSADAAGPDAGEAVTVDATAAVAPPPAPACPARPRGRPGVACPSPPDDSVGPCADVCVPRWYGCAGRCQGNERRCIAACKAEHRACMAGCF